jgi:predicted DNA-binding protein YlxM (UPF0122 family)
MGSRKTGAAAAELDKQHRALSLYIAGVSAEQIAKQEGCSVSSVYVRLRKALAELNKERNEMAEFLRGVQEQRLDLLFRAAFVKALKGDPRSIEVCLKVLERQAKLRGLDMPVTAEVTVTRRSEWDEQIEQLTKAMQAKADGKPVPAE